MRKSVLYTSQILTYADAYQEQTVHWPNRAAGPVAGTLDDTTWNGITLALQHGNRGLPGGSTLARLLAEQRQARTKSCLPQLTHKQILAWADTFYRQHQTWPHTE